MRGGTAVFLVSPTEPLKLRAIGQTSVLPETFGVDVMFPCPKGLVGIQRKTVADLVASVLDGRLHEGTLKMTNSLWCRTLILEGHPQWSSEGQLLGFNATRFSRDALWGILLSLQARGVWVTTTSNLDETIEWVQYLAKWAMKPDHTSLETRPGPASPWGVTTSRDWNIHVLQGFSGVGPGVAANIVDHFGCLPLQWTCTEKDLQQVEGIGKVRAKKLIEALEGRPNETEEQGA